MKKIYIKPSVSVCFTVLEPILQAESKIGKDQWFYGGGCAKKNDFTDDFFDDTTWPKGKSPWD
jgi:hypothetical protein